QRIHNIPPTYLRVIQPRAVMILPADLTLYFLTVIKVLIDTCSYNSFGFTERVVVVLLDNIAGSRPRALQGCPYVPQMIRQVIVVGVGIISSVPLQVAFLRMDHLNRARTRAHFAVFDTAHVVTLRGCTAYRSGFAELRSQRIIQIGYTGAALCRRFRKVQVVIAKGHPGAVLGGIAVSIVGVSAG